MFIYREDCRGRTCCMSERKIVSEESNVRNHKSKEDETRNSRNTHSFMKRAMFVNRLSVNVSRVVDKFMRCIYSDYKNIFTTSRKIHKLLNIYCINSFYIQANKVNEC